MGKQSYNEKEIEWLREHYATATKEEIESTLNKPFKRIQNKANRLGLKRDTEVVNKAIADKLSLCKNHDYFKSWTPNMAYVLGMWFADGTVMKDSNHVSLILHNNDVGLLDKIKDELGHGGKYIKAGNCNRLTIGSKELHDDLISLGCIPNKSYIGTIPIGMPDELVSHFIRGYFDGDGSVHRSAPVCNGKRYLYIEAKFLGTKDFIDWLVSKIPIEPTSIRRKRKEGPCWEIVYFNHKAVDVLDWLYKDATLFMDRKYVKYNELLKESDYRTTAY